jgi:hypothetical protein
MFDPAQSATLREPIPDSPMLANVAALTTLQREALVTLLCGSAILLPGMRRRARYVVPDLGEGWSIEPATIDALSRLDLVAVFTNRARRARLTPRGLWYARSAVHLLAGYNPTSDASP